MTYEHPATRLVPHVHENKYDTSQSLSCTRRRGRTKDTVEPPGSAISASFDFLQFVLQLPYQFKPPKENLKPERPLPLLYRPWPRSQRLPVVQTLCQFCPLESQEMPIAH